MTMQKSPYRMLIWPCLVVALMVLPAAFSNRQDDTNYRRFMLQDRSITGKAGVLLTAIGQPHHYDFEFFNNYMTRIFKAAFPPALQPVILGDKGLVLMDPAQLTASEEFTPARLVDCYGKDADKHGEPYVDKKYEWVPPREEGAPGHFLLKDAPNELIDIVEKVSIKIAVSYYGIMPDNVVPYMMQHRAIFDEVEVMLQKEFPGVPMRFGWAMYPETVEHAIDELIQAGAETIVVCDFFHVYSSLEEFNGLFVEIHNAVAERARVVYSPFVGACPAYRKAFVRMAEDEVLPLPKAEKKLLVLTRHGFPEIPGDPYPELARVFYVNMKKEIEQALEGTNTLVVFADTDFAGEDMDPDHKKLASFEALEMGLEEGYDRIIYLLIDFLSENTDTIFAMRLETFESLHFAYDGRVPYPDFTKPYRTELQEGKTRIVVAGTPVGERYRPFVSEGVFDALATVLRGEEWPELVLAEEEQDKPLF